MALMKFVAAALTVPLAVFGLHARSDPSAEAEPQGLLGGRAAAAENSEWPKWLRASKGAREKPYAEQKAEAQSKMAVLVSGSLENLILTPLLSNVVHTNARRGVQVDLFFSLVAPVRGSKPAVTTDPKVANLLLNFDEVGYNATVMDFVCELAKRQGATRCIWELENDNAVRKPKNTTYRNIMTQIPFTSPEGLETISRWRSQSSMLGRVRDIEGDDEYDAVMVTRANGYWMAPRAVKVEDFQADPFQVSTMPCLDETGINDNAVIMGREAANVMLGAFSAWQQGEEYLHGTRTAEEVLFRMASQAGLNVVPEPMYAAQALYTMSGLPCFRESTFNVNSEQQRMEHCFAENAGEAPVTSLFSAFSCETLNPNFFDLLWPQQVNKLHQIVSDITNRNESNAIVLTVVDQGEVEMAVKMLTSLQAAGEDAKSVVVGTSAGVCKALANSFGVAGHKCLVMMPSQDVRLRVFKHAILTTVAAAGLSRRVVSLSPGVTFATGMRTALAASQKTISFAKNSTPAQACREEPGDLAQVDGGVLYLSDAPEVTDMLLRAWKLMEEFPSASWGAALKSALRASGHSDFGLLSCGVALGSGAHGDRVVDAAQPPGVAEQIKQEVRRASESAWVDRLRGEASKQRQAHDSQTASNIERSKAWAKKTSEWKDMWAQRVRELQQENGYNATEAAAERRRLRVERKKQSQVHKKRVRYLPAEEVVKVQAKEDKWNAEVARQKADDLEKAEARREAFKRQVEEAQRIIQSGLQSEEEAPQSEEEASVA